MISGEKHGSGPAQSCKVLYNASGTFLPQPPGGGNDLVQLWALTCCSFQHTDQYFAYPPPHAPSVSVDENT